MACIQRRRFSTESLLGQNRGEARRRCTASVDQQTFSAKALQHSVGRAASEPANPATRKANACDGFCATIKPCDQVPRDGGRPQPCERLSDEDDSESAASSHTDASTSSTSPPSPLDAKKAQSSCSLGSPELPGLSRGSESSDRAATDSPAAVRGDEAGASPVNACEVPVEIPANRSLRHERRMPLAGQYPPPYTSSYTAWPGARVTPGKYTNVSWSGSVDHWAYPSFERSQIYRTGFAHAKVEFEEHRREDEDDEYEPEGRCGPDVDSLLPSKLRDRPNDLESLESEPEHLGNAVEGRYEDALVERLEDLRLEDETGSISFQTIYYDPEAPPSSVSSKSQNVERSWAWQKAIPPGRLNLQDRSLRKQLSLWTQRGGVFGPREQRSSSYGLSETTRRGILKSPRALSPGSPYDFIDESDELNDYDDVWPDHLLDEEPPGPPPELLPLQPPLLRPPSPRTRQRKRAPDTALKPVLREGDFLRLGIASGITCSAEERLCWDLRVSQAEGDGAESPDIKKSKACLRCRFQKQKCLIDEDNPEGPCLPCKSFSKTSRKTIHRTPCFRKKIGDVVLHRRGGLDLTKRWQGVELRDIHEQVPKGRIRTIAFTSDVCEVPIEVEVMRFTPRRGDVTKRYWTVVWKDKLVRKSKKLAPYCLVDIQRTAADFESYVDHNWQQAFLNHSSELPSRDDENLAVEDEDGTADDASENESFNSNSLRSDESVALPNFIEKTHRVAFLHFAQLPDKVKEDEDSNTVPNKEKLMLEALFKLWFTNRHTRGSSYICSRDTLGMRPEHEEGYPLPGKVSLPRMILAQFDSITYSRGLQVHSEVFLREMENLMARNHKKYWFTTYISMFVLLSEASWLTRDRYRHARQQYGHAVRYSIPAFVEELQEGCNIMLMHWHYYNCRPYPDPKKPQQKQKSFLADLTPLQYNLVMDTIQRPEIQRHLENFRRERENNGKANKPEPPKEEHPIRKYSGPQTAMDWDEPYYWVSQMFEEDWSPHRTYMRESVPVRLPTELDDVLASESEDEVEDKFERTGEDVVIRPDDVPVNEPVNEPINEPGPDYIEADGKAYIARVEEERKINEGSLDKRSMELIEANGLESRLRNPEIYTTEKVAPNGEDEPAYDDDDDDDDDTDISPISDKSQYTSSSSVSPEQARSELLKTFPFLQGRDSEELEELQRGASDLRRRMKRLRSLKEGERLTHDDLVLFGGNET